MFPMYDLSLGQSLQFPIQPWVSSISFWSNFNVFLGIISTLFL